MQWSLTDVPTSAGALARLPLAGSAEEFGHLLFEDDVCPLVNNIICVDKDDGLRRFIAATLPAARELRVLCLCREVILGINLGYLTKLS